jgi:hypothetical protein
MTRATAARPAPSASAKSRWNTAALWDYFNRSERPLTSLIFIAPLLLIYEIGTRYFSGGVLAVAWVHDFLGFFGATGRYLPAMAVVLILLFWHVARRDSWDVNPLHLAGMVVESVILALPLLMLCLVAATYLPMVGATESMPGLLTRSIGAGVYEELVFRLGAFSLLSFVLVDLLGVRKSRATIATVVIASLAFSLYHYLGSEPFRLRTFAFRTAAGIYFGIVFAFRGFGVSAGTHASYDVIVHLLRAVR